MEDDEKPLRELLPVWCGYVLDRGGLLATVRESDARALEGTFEPVRLRTYRMAGRVMYTITATFYPDGPEAPHLTLVGPLDEPRAGLHGHTLTVGEACFLMGYLLGEWSHGPPPTSSLMHPATASLWVSDPPEGAIPQDLGDS